MKRVRITRLLLQIKMIELVTSKVSECQLRATTIIYDMYPFHQQH